MKHFMQQSIIIILCWVITDVSCCKKKCSYTTCYATWRSFTPNPSRGSCVTQTAYVVYHRQTHTKSGGCPGSTVCRQGHRYRRLCSCKNVYRCSWGSWNGWSYPFAQGRCGHRTRMRRNYESSNYVHRASCSGVPRTCDMGMQQVQNEYYCSCKKVSNCVLGSWTGWSPGVPNNACRTQTRKKHYSPSYTHILRPNNCAGVSTKCNNPLVGRRIYCMCKYAICRKQAWSQWKTIPSDKKCLDEERFQFYSPSYNFKPAISNCNNVYPKTCPSPPRERRKKVVKCPRINPMARTKYLTEACNGDKSSCDALCNIMCPDKGYFVAGSKVAICLASGQWSTTIGHCVDKEEPVLTCPSPAPQQTDPNRDSATITLPQVTATDNSGEKPTFVITHRSPVQVYVGKNLAVIYTAMDAAGNRRNCTITLIAKDKEPPKVIFCPKDIVLQVNTFPHPVVWKNPTFFDNVDKEHVIATPDRANGQPFYRGKYDVNYKAIDTSGNQAFCKFSVQLGPVVCETHPPPKHGAVSCNKRVDGVKHVYICSPACKQGFWFLNVSDSKVYNFYMCEMGTWRGQNEFVPGGSNIGFTKNIIPRGQKPWPNCGAGSPPSGITKEYQIVAGECKSKQAQDALKKNLVKQLEDDLILKYAFCFPDKRNCIVENIQITCASRRKRGNDANKLHIKLVIKINQPSPTSDQGEAIENLKKFQNELAKTTAPIQNAFSSVTKAKSVVVEDKGISYACKTGETFVVVDGPGTEESRSKCVKCPAGTYLDSDTKKCKVCAIGSYQEDDGALSCQKCPKGYSTVATRATNHTECREICNPGTYSQTGIATCTACDHGSYQPFTASKSCIRCPPGKGTERAGSVKQSDCIKLSCPVGQYFNSETNKCTPCAVGLYQDVAGGKSCKNCPSGYSTLKAQSNSSKDCKEFCKPGTYSKTGFAPCTPCAKGTYQPLPKKSLCIKCSQGKITDKVGSAKETDCKQRTVKVILKSEGCDDPGIKHCGYAFIKVNGVEKAPKKRGYNIVVLDEKTGLVEQRQAFDTHCCSSENEKMVNFISGVGNGKIILVAIMDEASGSQTKGTLAALKSIGGEEPLQREYRGSFVLAGYKGTRKVSWIKQLTKGRGKGPSEIQLVIPLE